MILTRFVLTGLARTGTNPSDFLNIRKSQYMPS